MTRLDNWDIDFDSVNARKVDFILVCEHDQHPQADNDNENYFHVHVAVAYDPGDASVGYNGGWFVDGPIKLPAACLCGSPLPDNDVLERRICEELEDWAQNQEPDYV